jgi:outer membrane protein OmpA-like peptidoglycan-associated protein
MMKKFFILLLFSPFTFSQVKEYDVVKYIDLFDVVYFQENSVSIIEESNLKLDRIFIGLQENPTVTLDIVGNCDFTEKNKKKLSLKRSLTVIDFFVKKGIDRKRLKAKGFSDKKLTNNCYKINCSEKEKSQNRRVEFIVKAI